MYLQAVYSAQMAGTTEQQKQSDGKETSVTDQIQNVLGKNDFLQLLMTQLKYQNPMKPMDDTKFISQLAQFSTLEQMANLSEQMNQFMQFQRQSGLFGQMATLLGHEVKVLDPESEELVQGTVQSINWEDGVPQLIVNGEGYALSDVRAVIAA